jgi:hypothetical protein
MQQLKLKSIYMLWGSCSSSHIEHNKIGFAIFGFFYDVISNLQGTAITLKRWRNVLHARPCQILKFHKCALDLPHHTPTTVARSPAAMWGPGRQTSEQGVWLDSLEIDWRRRLGRGTARWWSAARHLPHLCGGEVPGECGGRAKP